MPQEPHPVFILGSGRCGSTLVQRLLNSCESVAIAGEHFGYLKGVAEAYFTVRGKLASTAESAGNLERNALAELGDPRRWTAWTNWLHWDAAVETFSRFLTDMLAPPGGGADYRYWGFKEVRYGCDDRVVEMLLELLPNARFVIIARHPINTVASMRQVNWEEGKSARHLADRWACVYRRLGELQASRPDRFHITLYEDLVTDGCPGLHELLDWLSLEFSLRHLEILNEPNGRLQSPSRLGGTDPVRLLQKHERRDIYVATRDVRSTVGYSITELLCLADGLTLEDSGDGCVLKTSNGAMHRLNSSGKLILMLCDGSHRIPDIVTALTEAYPGADRDDIELSTVDFIDNFLERGFLLPA